MYPPLGYAAFMIIAQLREFFGATRLNRIGAEQMLAYREWRAQGVGSAIINMEVGCLRRMLKRAKLWHTIADEIKPLREPRTIGRALSPEEKASLLELASTKPEWETAYYAAILALNTTMRGCEIKGLRWSDVDLLTDAVTIQRSKTEAGERVVPLTSDASDVLVRMRRRAEMLGPVDPSHYVFAKLARLVDCPGCGKTQPAANTCVCKASLRDCEARPGFDPTAPIGSWRTAWRKLTRTVRCPACGKQQNPGASCGNCGANIAAARSTLHGLRFHDLRHHAITELAESGASE